MIEPRFQTIFSAAGNADDQFFSSGFKTSKNLARTRSGRILERAYNSYKSLNNDIFVVRDSERFLGIEDALLSFTTNSKVVFTNHATQGALASACLAADLLDQDLPVIVAPGDSEILEDGIVHQVEKLILSDADGGVICFEAAGPKWSYVKTRKDGSVIEVAEKREISNLATTGVFFFRNPKVFLESATWAMVNRITTNGQYFTSSAINSLLFAGKKVQAVSLRHAEIYRNLANADELESKGDIWRD